MSETLVMERIEANLKPVENAESTGDTAILSEGSRGA